MKRSRMQFPAWPRRPMVTAPIETMLWLAAMAGAGGVPVTIPDEAAKLCAHAPTIARA